MRLKCVAIDDGPLALKIIRNFVSRFPALELLQTFDNAVAGAEFLKSTPIDLLFIDINMPDISGLNLVRALEHKPMVIFTTAFKEYAYDSYELNALDYLLKPIDFERFSKSVQKAIDYYAARTISEEVGSESLVVCSEYRKVKIPLHDIEFIEGFENYLKVHLMKGESVITLMSLKKIQEKLPSDKFKRIHRSFLIPVSKIKSVSKRNVLLVTNRELPIGDSYLKFVQDWENS